MPRLLGCLVGLALITNGTQAQTNPVMDQFNRLMGAPKHVTGMLLDYPWRANLPAELAGLRRVEQFHAVPGLEACSMIVGVELLADDLIHAVPVDFE
jgi:hypothetical protein